MNVIDYMVLGLVLLALGFAVWYIRRSKRKGRKCIGCPAGGTCNGNCSSCNEK